MSKIFLISYDIGDDQRRKKVADSLLYFGLYRVQYSVFAGSLRKSLLPRVEQRLNKILLPADRLFILPLTPGAADNIIEFGEKGVDWHFLFHGSHTLYID